MEGGWILDGQKRWIGNATFADVLIVFARNTTTNQINGYVKDKCVTNCLYMLKLVC